MHPLFYVFLFWLLPYGRTAKQKEITFPNSPKFLFGTATAAYQTEGAWNISGKGENIWDRYTHQYPNKILDNSNGDIACDSYHKFREDVQLLKYLGVDFYRFSLSWSRILPTGRSYKVNPDGIRFYNEFIDELIQNGITPMVTIFHWDTPQPLQDLGGFANELMVEWFEEFAEIAFENFGDRVKLWITFNEPKQTCLEGTGKTVLAPALNSSGIGEYICAHNVLKAHARAWHLYDTKFRKDQQGKVGITLDAFWSEPISSHSNDTNAAERMTTFLIAWFSDPIFSKDGDYPKVMKDFIRERSLKENFKQSRLPEFTEEEVQYIKGTYDFFGLNHYTSVLAQDTPNAPYNYPSFNNDARVNYCRDPSWQQASSTWLTVVPCGFEKLLIWIRERYKHNPNLEIYVTENGYSDYGELNDTARIEYYRSYLSAMKNAMDKGVNVKAYTAWSLLDNFEWRHGYVYRFGIYYVNFEDPERKRVPKASVRFYKELLETRTLKSDENVLGTCNISVTITSCTQPNDMYRI